MPRFGLQGKDLAGRMGERKRGRGKRVFNKFLVGFFLCWNLCIMYRETDNSQTQRADSRWIEMISVYYGMLLQPLDQTRVIGWSSGVHGV